MSPADDEMVIVARQIELTALAVGSWKLVSFVCAYILPDNY